MSDNYIISQPDELDGILDETIEGILYEAEDILTVTERSYDSFDFVTAGGIDGTVQALDCDDRVLVTWYDGDEYESETTSGVHGTIIFLGRLA